MKREELSTANLMTAPLACDKIAGVYYKDGRYCLYLNRGSKTERWVSSDLTEWQKEGNLTNEKGKPIKLKEGSFLFRNGKIYFFQSEWNGVTMYSSQDGVQFLKHPIPVLGLFQTPGFKTKYSAPKMFYAGGKYHMAVGSAGKLHWLTGDRLTEWKYEFPMPTGKESVSCVFGCDGKVGVMTKEKESDFVTCGDVNLGGGEIVASEKENCYRYVTPKSVPLPNGTVQLFYLIPKDVAAAKDNAQKKPFKGEKILAVSKICMNEKEFALATPEELRQKSTLLVDETGVLDGVRSYRDLSAGCEGTFQGDGEWKTVTETGEWTVKTKDGTATVDGENFHVEGKGNRVSVRMSAGGTEWLVNGKTVYADGTASRADKMTLSGSANPYSFRLYRIENGDAQ